jgi:predicted acetyltransferase
MNKKDAVKSLWRECFADSDAYVEMFFSQVYREDEAMLLMMDGEPVSSLLLQHYAMNFHGVMCTVSYICGAATARQQRCHGNMSRLMAESLRESYKRGDIASTLIPANEYLFGYYKHFGFSPAFYVDIERYTSAHTFKFIGEYLRYDTPDSDEAFDFFTRKMLERPCTVQHSREQYRNILMDNSVDGGSVVMLSYASGGVCAMAFAVPSDDEVKVVELLSDNINARNAVLEEVHNLFAGLPITVYGYYDPSHNNLEERGMLRIVNVKAALSIVGRVYPHLNMVIRVTDKIIAENNHVYRVSGGECVIDDDYTDMLDYDMDIEMFTSMNFGNEVTRKIMDYPAVRPFISLMLD